MIFGDDLRFIACGLDHGRRAFFVEAPDEAVGVERGGGIGGADTVLPELLAVLRSHVLGDADVGDHEDALVGAGAEEQRAGAARRAALVTPGDVGLGDVAGAVSADRPQVGLAEAGGDVDGAVGVGGLGDVGEAGVVAVPQLLAGVHVVGVHPVGADADHLVPALVADDDRRVVGLAQVGVHRAVIERAVGAPGEL